MRTILLPVLVLVLGCSSKAAGPTAGSPTVAIPVASATPSTPASTPPIPVVSAPPPPSVHIVRLPDQPYDPLYPPYRSIDWAPGEAPRPAFPNGTVYVVTRDPTPNAPVSVTEWDLARAAIVRTVPLPVSLDEGSPWILRVGDELRVLAHSDQSLSLISLTKDLRLEGAAHWVDRVALPGASAFGADAKLTVVAYPAGISQDKGDRLVLATFDATGKRRGTRNFWNASHERIAAVLGGRVFVLLWIKTGVELLALGPDLGVQKRVLVSREESGNLRLETRDGRLQAITGYPVPHAVEFSASLETLGPATPLEYPRPIELGDEEVHLCEFYGRAWIAWSTTSQDACHASPADLLEAPPADD